MDATACPRRHISLRYRTRFIVLVRITLQCVCVYVHVRPPLVLWTYDIYHFFRCAHRKYRRVVITALDLIIIVVWSMFSHSAVVNSFRSCLFTVPVVAFNGANLLLITTPIKHTPRNHPLLAIAVHDVQLSFAACRPPVPQFRQT